MNNDIANLLIDYDTGEVIKEIKYGDRVKIVSKKQVDYLNATTCINKNKTFGLLISKSLLILSTLKLTSTEYSVLAVLISHLGFGTYGNIAIKLKNKQFYNYLKSDDIIKIINCSTSSFNRAIKGLEEKEIIKTQKKGRDNIFIINPFIITNDKRISKKLFTMFVNSRFNYTNEYLPLNK